MTRDDSPDAIRARLSARTRAVGATARVVAVRFDGVLDDLCGRTGDRGMPRSVAEFASRADAIRAAREDAVARLLAASSADGDAAFRAGVDRAWLIVPNDPTVDARLTEARAAIEADGLVRWQGSIAPVIAWADVPSAELDAAATVEALDSRLSRRAATPFLDALGGEAPCGPFAADPSAQPTYSAMNGPIAVMLARRVRPAGLDLSAAIAFAAQSFETQANAEERVHAAATASGELVAGSLREVLRLGSTIDSDASLVIDGSRSESGLPGALARARAAASARGLSMFGVRAPADRLASALALGDALSPLAKSQPAAMRELLEVAARIDDGTDHAPLMLLSRWRARAHAIASALGVDERAVRNHPEGSRASAHEAALDLERPERAALKVLIREFPRWFDTGAARIPLWCALQGVDAAAEVCSA